MKCYPSFQAALCVAFFLAAHAAARAQIIVNGSFESPAHTFTQNISGTFSFTGWSGTASSNGGNAGLVVGTDNGLAPAHGNQHYTFNGGNPSDQGYIEQTFSTTTGASYQLSFQIGRAGGGQDLRLTATLLNGATTLAFGEYTPGGSGTYTTQTLNFTATGTSTTLRFTDISGGNSISDLYIDNVAVTASAIPEPSTYALILGMLAAAAAAHRKRKHGPR